VVYLLSVIVFAGILAVLAGVLAAAERVLVDHGTRRVDINAGRKVFDAEGGQTLLSALYEEQVFLPSACGGAGSCGHCKVEVLSGGGPVLPTETPHLTRKEVRSGVRLACQLRVREDLRVRIPPDLMDVRLFSAAVEGARHVTHDTREIRLLLDDPPGISHRPGQYVQVRVPSSNGPVFRAYSISSPVHEPGVVELAVRLVPGGAGSTYLHGVGAGDRVEFTGPYGEFELSDDPSVEIVCVGGGCGIAPIRSIIHSLYARWPERSCWLFLGCRTARDAVYLDESERLAGLHPNFRVVCALSGPPGPEEEWVEWSPTGPDEGSARAAADGRIHRETGFIHLSADRHLEPGVARQAFLCGPPPMVEATAKVLKGKGLRDGDIFCDSF
jgi:Na+-transporting NADH:ubiquinone oxidoreductase subunit F